LSNLAREIVLSLALFAPFPKLDAELSSAYSSFPTPQASVVLTAQDTTKPPQAKKPVLPRSEIERIIPRIPPKSFRTAPPGMLNLVDSRDHHFSELTLDVIDSLSNLHPELRDYLLQQAIILGGLRMDSAQAETRQLLQRALADITVYGELEAKLRRNQALYGTTENPMKPPPPPYQIDLFALIIAISNLLHYLGIR
jgi:hypothetical protein